MSKNQLDGSKGEALYLQVKDILIQRILSKAWPVNSLIPTEQELMKEFDVSRTTIRQAISIMEQDGLIEKKQGKGTIVKQQKLVGSLGQLKGFAEEVLERGQVPHSKLIRAEFRDNLHHEKSLLHVDESEPILLIERIRFADDIPIALERTCWTKSIGELLMKHDLNTVNFYEVLESNQIYLKSATEKISAINATINEADSLGIRGGEALLEMTRLSFGLDDKPLEYAKTKYRSDYYQYHLDLKR